MAFQIGNWLIYTTGAYGYNVEIRRDWAGLWEIDLGFLHLRQYP